MLPVALGANGQPPIPPTDASRTSRPRRSPRTRSRSRSSACCAGGRRPARRARRRRRRGAGPGAGRRRRRCPRRRSRPAPPPRARPASSRTRPGSIAPSNGQPNAVPIVTVARIPSSCARATIRTADCSRVLDRRALVSLVERLAGREREVHLVEARLAQPVVAPVVEREAGVHDAGTRLDRRDDLLGAGHLRDARRVDEAHRLDPRQPGSGEPVDELARTAGSSDFGRSGARRAARRRKS